MICPANDEEYLTPDTVAEMAPGRSDRAVRLLTAARLYMNSLSAAPMNWMEINPNFNDCHSNPMVLHSTLCIPDITDWWHPQEETHSKYAELCNVA
jgi:hypothetical protein